MGYYSDSTVFFVGNKKSVNSLKNKLNDVKSNYHLESIYDFFVNCNKKRIAKLFSGDMTIYNVEITDTNCIKLSFSMRNCGIERHILLFDEITDLFDFDEYYYNFQMLDFHIFSTNDYEHKYCAKYYVYSDFDDCYFNNDDELILFFNENIDELFDEHTEQFNSVDEIIDYLDNYDGEYEMPIVHEYKYEQNEIIV